MLLRFKGSKGWRDVKSGLTFDNEKEIFRAIKEDIKQYYPHFTSYYIRYWMEDNRVKFDVGDYTCFYYLELEEGETWQGKVQESLLR